MKLDLIYSQLIHHFLLLSYPSQQSKNSKKLSREEGRGGGGGGGGQKGSQQPMRGEPKDCKPNDLCENSPFVPSQFWKNY